MKYCQNILFTATIYLRNTNDILMNIKISDLKLHSESFKIHSSDNKAQQSSLFQWKKGTNKCKPLKRITQRTASQSITASRHESSISIDKFLAFVTCKVLHFNGQSRIKQKHRSKERNKSFSFKCYFIASHSYLCLAEKLPIKVYTLLRLRTVFHKLFD